MKLAQCDRTVFFTVQKCKENIILALKIPLNLNFTPAAARKKLEKFNKHCDRNSDLTLVRCLVSSAGKTIDSTVQSFKSTGTQSELIVAGAKLDAKANDGTTALIRNHRFKPYSK